MRIGNHDVACTGVGDFHRTRWILIECTNNIAASNDTHQPAFCIENQHSLMTADFRITASDAVRELADLHVRGKLGTSSMVSDTRTCCSTSAS